MNIKAIISEEIEKQSEKFNLKPTELKGFLKELFSFSSSQILKNIGNQDEILDDKEALPEEFWQELINTINESYSEYQEDWEKELREIKFQILCSKYFTKQDLGDLDEVEKKLRTSIKKYFSSLQNYTSTENFKERFFNLPTKILFDFIRYILNKSSELNGKLKISKGDLKERVEELKASRKKIIDKISFISNRNVTILDLKLIKKLVDNGVFYEDNLLNRGISEYLYKLCSHTKASENVIETFNSTFLNDLKYSIETSKSYMSHISAVKNDEEPEYFTEKGVQIGRRFDKEIESVKNNDTADAIIDKDSIFKEPSGRIKSATYAWDSVEDVGETGEDAEGDMGSGSELGGGGGSFGGGSYSGPTGGDETVDLDMGGEGDEEDTTEDGMPTGDDGFPTDFGTPESNDTEEKPDQEK